MTKLQSNSYPSTYKNYISIICSVYQSHEIFKEQLMYLHFELKGLNNNAEMIFIDDGSTPPLGIIFNEFLDSYIGDHYFCNFRILNTHCNIPWNQHAGRNLGVKYCQGNYLLFFDIDHIITKAMVIELLNFKYDMLRWNRQYGVLKDGIVINNLEELQKQYNIYLRKRLHPPYNIFGILKELFEKVGGYDESLCGEYGGDIEFMHKLIKDNLIIGAGNAYMYTYPNTTNDRRFHQLKRVIKRKRK